MFRTALCLVVFSSLLALPALAAPQGKAPATTGAKSTAVVNINTASASDFEALPGIGAHTLENLRDPEE